MLQAISTSTTNAQSELMREMYFRFIIRAIGAVVGQQPFGGARASGTNDKAGSLLNLLRWVSARTVKETFTPYYSWDYPHMREPQPSHVSNQNEENANKKRRL